MNDAFVMDAWGASAGADGILMLADGNGGLLAFASAGWVVRTTVAELLKLPTGENHAASIATCRSVRSICDMCGVDVFPHVVYPFDLRKGTMVITVASRGRPHAISCDIDEDAVMLTSGHQRKPTTRLELEAMIHACVTPHL